MSISNETYAQALARLLGVSSSGIMEELTRGNLESVIAAHQEQIKDILSRMSEVERAAILRELPNLVNLLDPRTPEQKAAKEKKDGADPYTGKPLDDVVYAADDVGIDNDTSIYGGLRRGSFGFGRARPGEGRFSKEPELEKIIASTQDKGTLKGVTNLATALLGQAEEGKNGGAIVRATMGYEGDPWCGGFVRYAFEKAGVFGVYDQSDYRSALSYRDVAGTAFRERGSGYTPQPGDVVVFSRGGNGKGHVGIVVEVNGNEVTYISGNDGDMVKARTFSLNSPPSGLLGYSDTRALAATKKIDLDKPVDAPKSEPELVASASRFACQEADPGACVAPGSTPSKPPIPATRHNQADFMGG
jgi:uncharacterized protein (TIGR02594 family)